MIMWTTKGWGVGSGRHKGRRVVMVVQSMKPCLVLGRIHVYLDVNLK